VLGWLNARPTLRGVAPLRCLTEVKRSVEESVGNRLQSLYEEVRLMPVDDIVELACRELDAKR
jgi:hypothetical protein